MARALTPELEELARLIGDLVGGSRLTAGERAQFEGATDDSNEYPVQLRAADGAKRGLPRNTRRRKLIIQNLSASDIFFGNERVTVDRGIRIVAGQSYTDSGDGTFTGEVFLVTAAVGPLDIRCREE